MVGDSDSSLRQRIVSTVVPDVLRRRFAAKLALMMLTIVALVAVVGGLGYVQTQETVQQNTERQLVSTAELQADSLANWRGNVDEETVRLSTAEEMTGSSDNVTEYLQFETPTGSRAIRAVHVVNVSAGRLVGSTEASLSGLQGSDEPWTDTANLEIGMIGVGSTSFGGVYEGTSGKLAYFYAPVAGAGDRAVVVVSRVGNRVNFLHQPYENQRTYLVDRDSGTTIVGGSGDAYVASVADPRNEVDLSRETVRTRDSRMYAASRVGDSEWVLVTAVPRNEALETADLVGRSVLFVVGVGIVGTLVVAGVIGRSTVRPIRRLRDKARQMEEGDLVVDLDTGRIDEIGQLYDGFDSMRTELRAQIREATEARENAEAAREETERINDRLETTAASYATVMQRAADGDLTARMETTADNESMRTIAAEFNEMLAEIETTTARVKTFATEVAAASEEVTASSEEVSTASEQVSESIQQISDGAERQHDALATVDDELSSLSTTTEEIAASSDEVADIAERTARAGREGRQAAQQAIEGMNSIETRSDAAVEEIEALQAEIAQVDELLEFIADLAKQTNMLALNANIEASRSGDDSVEGFTAVAGEVKELSADTKEAAEEIEALLEGIKAQTDRTATEVRRASSEVSEHTDSVRSAADSLQQVAEHATETNAGVQERSRATGSQAESTEQVVTLTDRAVTISEETTSEAENVAAAAEEQTTALSAVTDSASDLSSRASRLSTALDRFETDAAAADSAGAAAELPDGEVTADAAGDTAKDAAPNGGDGPGAFEFGDDASGFTDDDTAAEEDSDPETPGEE